MSAIPNQHTSVTQDKSGNNVVQKIDIKALASEFIRVFYLSWKQHPRICMENSNLFYEHSRISFEGTTCKGHEIITILNLIWEETNFDFEISKFNLMDSGSRRIDILVNGFITKKGTKYPFSQYFLLTYIKDSWKLHNSIINIFI
jgi:hypothetical protein